MDIRFLGTSAAPSTPIQFCTCECCATARKHGGKNYRRRSSLLVNKDLLIDIGPDITAASYEYDLHLENVKICLQTHSHEDHFDPELIMCRHSEYGTKVNSELLLVASESTLRGMDAIIGRRCDYGSIFDADVQEILHLQVQPVRPFERITIGNYHIVGLEANHDSSQICMLYSIQFHNSFLLYATDTSIIPESTLDYFRRNRIMHDLIILDHTYGIGYESRQNDHLGAEDFKNYARRFKEDGLLADAGLIYATHLSHEGLLDHDTMDEYAKGNGYRIAYDGLHLEI